MAMSEFTKTMRAAHAHLRCDVCSGTGDVCRDCHDPCCEHAKVCWACNGSGYVLGPPAPHHDTRTEGP